MSNEKCFPFVKNNKVHPRCTQLFLECPNDLIPFALTFAAQKHRDQRRKGADASPYINHPIALADVLCNEAGVTVGDDHAG